MRARLLPDGTGRYCLAIGTAEPRKDLPGLVRAFAAVAARHADVALVLAGPEGWGEDELQACAGGVAGPRSRIARTGWVEPLELAALLRGAHVLAYPSRYEGFGFPPLQAMQAGVPVVATAVGSLPEVLGDGALLVEPGDQDGLAGALDGCLDDEALRVPPDCRRPSPGSAASRGPAAAPSSSSCTGTHGAMSEPTRSVLRRRRAAAPPGARRHRGVRPGAVGRARSAGAAVGRASR